tara:strand:- start:10767 stop:11675 length:909 start_codon:yes stop_codon:yes gene_type:complete
LKKKILIIGGTGYLGYSLSKHCININWNVWSISKKKPKKHRYVSGVKYKYCDIFNKKKLMSLLKENFDYVVNFGGYVDHINIKRTFNTHFIGVKNLVALFKSKNIKSFIQIGSSSEYGTLKSPHHENSKCSPKMIYGKSKYKATKFLLKEFKNNKFPVTILRFYQVYGPGQDENRFIPIIINSCLKKKNFPCSNARQFRDFLYIDDAIRAVMKCLKHKESKGKIFNISTGKPEQLKKIIFYIKRKLKGGNPLFGKIKLRKDELKYVYPSTKLAWKTINWKYQTPLYLGLKKTMNFYKNDFVK